MAILQAEIPTDENQAPTPAIAETITEDPEAEAAADALVG